MVWPRDVIILNAVKGIEELVVMHTRTKGRMVYTSEKLVTMVVPKLKYSGKSSQSKNKVQSQTQPDEGQGQANVTGTFGGVDGNPYMDDQDCPDPNPSLEDSQPHTTVCMQLVYIDRYAHTTQNPMEQWIQFHSQYLHVLLETEGKPVPDNCSLCGTSAYIKCPDCHGLPSYCKICVLYAHQHSPFHRPLVWTATHYTQVSLQSLGFVLYLGHSGLPCPETVEVCTYAHVQYDMTGLY